MAFPGTIPGAFQWHARAFLRHSRGIFLVHSQSIPEEFLWHSQSIPKAFPRHPHGITPKAKVDDCFYMSETPEVKLDDSSTLVELHNLKLTTLLHFHD